MAVVAGTSLLKGLYTRGPVNNKIAKSRPLLLKFAETWRRKMESQVLNCETQFSNLTQKIKINRLNKTEHCSYKKCVCLSIAISIKFFFSPESHIADTEAKNSDCAIKYKIYFFRPTGKQVKDLIKYFHLVAGTCPTNSSHEGTKHSLWNKSPGLVPQIQTSLNPWN